LGSALRQLLHSAGHPAASAARGLRLVLMEIGRLEQMGLSFRQAPAIVTHGDPAARPTGEKSAMISGPI